MPGFVKCCGKATRPLPSKFQSPGENQFGIILIINSKTNVYKSLLTWIEKHDRF